MEDVQPQGQEPSPKPPRPNPVGRDELNLAEFPITLLSDKTPKGLKTLEFQDQIVDPATGKPINRKVTITASDKYGLPGPLDMDVLLCLIQLTRQSNGFTNPEVEFGRGELLRMLGMPDSGKHYRRVDLALRRWLSVTLFYENSWWDKRARRWTTSEEGWHILDNLSLLDRAAAEKQKSEGQLDLFRSSFTWNKVFFRSCQAENIKRLDLDAYFSLKNPISRRVYRFLDKRFYHRQEWRFDLKEFAFEHVGISRKYDVGEIKQKLGPSLAELEAAGFIEPMSRTERYTKLGPGMWQITLVRKPVNVPEESAAHREVPQDGTDPLATALVARGVTASTAMQLVREFPAERIQAKVETFDWLANKKDKRVSKSPAGYLVGSIREDYATPAGFVSKAERERQAAAEHERRRQEVEAKQRKRAEHAREVAAQTKVRKYWESLNESDQAQLDREAFEGAAEDLQKSLELSRGCPLETMARRLIREAHIRKLLGLPEALSSADG